MIASTSAEIEEAKKSRKGKRIEKIKGNRKCLAFGRLGQWLKGNPSCLRIMEGNNRGPQEQNTNRDRPTGGAILVHGSVASAEPNPIIDNRAPTSTGGIRNAAALCDRMGIPLHVKGQRTTYMHGWGENA